ncbi:phage holin family protein [Kaistella rhinocerotis]|uniref:phage holin family protein n=1 Tax=Kaistella rhinocerotis TaxID=3026437 RepID=UPI002554012D|nr:phage holin family protein [Kaistella sp. Ran72]
MLDLVKEYTSKRLTLLKMEATEKSSVTAGTVTYLTLAAVAALFFIILLNIGLGFLIGTWVDNYGYGFLILAGFYMLLILIVFAARNAIKAAVANKIIKSLNS